MRLPLSIILMGMLLCAQADPLKLVDKDYLKLELSVVASQGFTYSDRNSYLGNNFNYRESVLGILVSSRRLPGLTLSAQGEYRTAGGTDQDPRFRLGHVFLEHRRSLLPNWQVNVKTGRVRNPLGFYNETRDILWTRPGVSLPQSVYLSGLGLRQFMSFIEGARADTEYALGDHTFSAGFLIGHEPLGAGGNRALGLGLPDSGQFSGPPTVAYYASYSWLSYLTLKFYQLRRDQQLDLFQPSPTFRIRGIASNDVQSVFSARVRYGPAAFTSEYALYDFNRDLGVNIPVIHGSRLNIPLEGWYVQGEYNVLDNVTLLARYDTQHIGFKDSRGNNIPTGGRDLGASDIVFGVNWRIMQHVLLSTEYHHVEGTIWLNRVDNPVIESNRYNLIEMMLSVRF